MSAGSFSRTAAGNRAYVASVSVRFRSKEQGARVKDRVKNGASLSFFRSRSIFRAAKTENLVLRSFFAPIQKPGNTQMIHSLSRFSLKNLTKQAEKDAGDRDFAGFMGRGF